MYRQYLATAMEAIKSAEEIVMHYYKQEVRSRLKEDQSPVTIADEEAEQSMRDIISKAFPDHGFIGEEQGHANSDSEFKWIIDPIDGTKNFMRQVPMFGSLLALMHNDQVVLGISNAFPMNELGYAIKGEGAYINDERVYVSKTDQLKDAWVTYGGMHYFAKYDRMNYINNIASSAKRLRAMGDLWGFHLVASGKFDAILEAEAKIWDVAPGLIMIEEAGGKVTDLDGQPITTNSTNIFASNGLLHDPILTKIKGNI